MQEMESLAQEITDSGIRRVFGIPGSGSSLVLADALEKLGVEFQLVHMEASAALMAGAAGRLSGTPGVAVSIKGPGLANMLPGISACALETFPIVTISEAYGPDVPVTRSHKRMDHGRMLSALVRGHCRLAEGVFGRAAALACSEAPGPVHIDLVSGDPPALPGEPEDPAPDGSEACAMDRTMEIIERSSRPVVMTGTLGIRCGLHELLNTLKVPVFSTAAAKGVVDETLPHAAGIHTGVGLELAPERRILSEADLVVCIGLRHNEVLKAKPFACSSVGLDPLGDRFSFGFDFTEYVAAGADDFKTVLDAVACKEWGTDLIDAMPAEFAESVFAGDFLPAHVYASVENRFKGECRIVLDTGFFCTVGERVCRVRQPDRYLASGQGRYMGIGLPLAIGAAMQDSSGPTAVFLGDGSIGMFISELKLAVQRKLPLIVVLMTDGAFGSIRADALRQGLTEKPLMISDPSWIAIVGAFGISTVRASSRAGIEDALRAWDSTSGPLFIEAVFDGDSYVRMTDGLR